MGGGRAEARRRSTARTRVALPSPLARSRSRRLVFVLVALTAVVAAVGAYLAHDGSTHVETAALPAKPPAKPARPSPSPSSAPASALPAPAPRPAPPASPPKEAPAPAEAKGPAARAEAPEAMRSERAARPRARNPWQAPVPRALKQIRDRVAHGARMSQKALRPAYDYAHENPSDPRPWLLLGHAYAELDWFSDSVDRYVRADHVDSTCRGDPQMLADLLDAAAHPTANRGAARAIRDIYGAEAIPALDKAMKRATGDREASARLARLRESLPR